MNSFNHGFKFLATTMAGCALMMGGCSSSPANESVSGRAQAFDRTTHPLLAGDLASVNGTYGSGCTNRSGDWSLAIASGASLDHAALTVVLNNAGCVLTLTELRAASGAITAVPAIALSDSFPMAASSFGSPIQFYASARLSAVTFASAFTLSIVFSDDLALASAANTSNFAVTTSSASASSVPAPDYGLDVSGISLQTDDANLVVTESGSAALATGVGSGQTGQKYVVVEGAITADGGAPAYAQINAAYGAGTAVDLTATIAVAAFTLHAVDLSSPQVRTLILANISSEGVRSYQVFAITFNSPVRN